MIYNLFKKNTIRKITQCIEKNQEQIKEFGQDKDYLLNHPDFSNMRILKLVIKNHILRQKLYQKIKVSSIQD